MTIKLSPPSFFHSLRFRLVLWFTAILALVMFAFSAFIYLSQERDRRGEALYRMERKFRDVEEMLTISPSIPLNLSPMDVLLLLGPNNEILASHGTDTEEYVETLIAGAEAARQANPTDHPAPVAFWFDTGGSSAEPYFYLVKPILTAGQPAQLILGNPYDPYGLDNRLLVTLLLGNLLTLGVAVGGGLWLADRALRPVQTITQAAQTISETDLNRRLNLKGRDELAQLANTFDGMLGRLQAAFERQRQFVADASHELRTPLTIVNLESSRALASKRTVDEYQRALGVIRSENEFMSHLVNDLLTLARMDSGQMVLEKTPLDLSDLALEAVERLAQLAERKNVRLETGDLPEALISGDRRYLLQMLSNLVENGIKYTGGEARRVHVETGLEGDSVWVRVSDSGPGIPPEHLPQLFERFYRVDQARSRAAEDESAGSGLGLSIVQWIAAAHAAQVRVESVPGEGTTFEVRFKAAG